MMDSPLSSLIVTPCGGLDVGELSTLGGSLLPNNIDTGGSNTCHQGGCGFFEILPPNLLSMEHAAIIQRYSIFDIVASEVSNPLWGEGNVKTSKPR